MSDTQTPTKKSYLATAATIVAIVAALVGTYVSLSSNLTAAKASRDEQMKGYAVQLSVQKNDIEGLKSDLATLAHRNEVDGLKDDIENLRKWQKTMTERMNTQEKAFHDRQSESLENRINRLEDASMGATRKHK